jgi:Holliday junction resolvase RusA-like endonuclease
MTFKEEILIAFDRRLPDRIAELAKFSEGRNAVAVAQITGDVQTFISQALDEYKTKVQELLRQEPGTFEQMEFAERIEANITNL